MEVQYHNVCRARCVSLICFRVNCWQRIFDGLLALKLEQAACWWTGFIVDRYEYLIFSTNSPHQLRGVHFVTVGYLYTIASLTNRGMKGILRSFRSISMNSCRDYRFGQKLYFVFSLHPVTRKINIKTLHIKSFIINSRLFCFASFPDKVFHPTTTASQFFKEFNSRFHHHHHRRRSKSILKNGPRPL